jgi:hypothetical protein
MKKAQPLISIPKGTISMKKYHYLKKNYRKKERGKYKG